MSNNTIEKETESIIDEKDKESRLPNILAVDFDGTLVTNEFPNIGTINHIVLDAVLHMKNDGWKIILYTSRTGNLLDEAVEFCHKNGLDFDAINDNIDEVKALGWNARKVFATIYLDDRTGMLDQLGKIHLTGWKIAVL